MSRETKAVLVAVGGVLLALLLGYGILAMADPEDVNLGDDEFEVGRTEVLARDIDDNEGRPLIFADLVGGDRDIYVQHVGDDADDGWFAFETRIPDTDGCLAEWDGDAEVFRSSCDGEATFPPDGEGLRQYPTEVDDDDRLIVDLRE